MQAHSTVTALKPRRPKAASVDDLNRRHNVEEKLKQDEPSALSYPAATRLNSLPLTELLAPADRCFRRKVLMKSTDKTLAYVLLVHADFAPAGCCCLVVLAFMHVQSLDS